MRRLITILFVCLFALPQAKAGTVLQNVYARHTQTLNGSWNCIVDPFDNGYYDYRLNVSNNGFF